MSEQDQGLDLGEPVVRRGEATCMSGFVPLGTGKIVLTPTRLLWYSNAGILNLPFSLWRPAVEIRLGEIDEVTSLLTGTIRVKLPDALYGFALTAGSRFNPLFVVNSWRAARSFKAALVGAWSAARAKTQ